MVEKELPLWLILVCMPLVLPFVARPFVRRGWTKSFHHIRKGRMVGTSYLYAHACKLLVFVFAYLVTGALLGMLSLFF